MLEPIRVSTFYCIGSDGSVIALNQTRMRWIKQELPPSRIISVVAQNEQGRAQVDGKLQVEPVGTLLLDPISQASYQKVQELEAPRAARPEEADIEYGPPHFTSKLQSVGNLVEGQPGKNNRPVYITLSF